MTVSNPRKAFRVVALSVFALVFGLWMVRTMLQPRTYAAAARVDLKAPSGRMDAAALQAQADAVISEDVLDAVVQRLNLNARWGHKLRVEGELKTWESVTVLKQKLEVSLVDGTNALNIRVDYADDSHEAAQIANTVADVYCALPSVTSSGLRATVSQPAQLQSQPAHPNIPLSLGLAAVVATVLALVFGFVAWIFVSQMNRSAATTSTTQKAK